MWTVNIVDDSTGEIVHSIECSTEKKADKVADGVAINLDWDKFSIEIKESK